MKWRFETLVVGDNGSMSIAPQSRAELGEPDPAETTCAVCGASVEGGSIEDSSGWRWFSDGRGGLLSLCASCPVPDDITVPA